ncbi:zinc finger and BTB domain-containing protein 5 [Grus japonensis]|uniref:Zinc finger and BTB domain-containing protein 5 n=1 Tax=Grus japonensis TaxID=30415 RepID=A0ABC9Y5C0_GRUJA
MVEQIVPWQPKEDYSGADIHSAACGGPHIRAGGNALKEAAAASGEHTPGHVFWQKLPYWSSLLLKDCTLWRGPIFEQFVKDFIPWEEPHTGAEEQHVEEGAAERNRYGLTTTPIPHSPVPLSVVTADRGVGCEGVRLSLRRGRIIFFFKKKGKYYTVADDGEVEEQGKDL